MVTLKDVATTGSEIIQLLNGKGAKEEMIHQGMVAPQFFVGTAGGPAYTNSQGVPWSTAYINGDVGRSYFRPPVKHRRGNKEPRWYTNICYSLPMIHM